MSQEAHYASESLCPTVCYPFSKPHTEPDVELSQERVWGPVSLIEARYYGAPAACLTVSRKPHLTDNLRVILERVQKLVPVEIFPTHDDTPQDLARRHQESLYLDDIHVLRHGNGKGGRVALNGTTYPQPRRVTYSVIPRESQDDFMTFVNNGVPEDATLPLFAYTQHGRLPADWRCRLMPLEIYDLMTYLHKFASRSGYLSLYCQQRLPTACQVMM